MVIPSRRRRGLSSIKSSVPRSVRPADPHVGFLRIAAIEMEKRRVNLEIRNARARLAELQTRNRELDREKRIILQLMGDAVAVPKDSTTAQEPSHATRVPAAATELPVSGDVEEPDDEPEGARAPSAPAYARGAHEEQSFAGPTIQY